METSIPEKKPYNLCIFILIRFSCPTETLTINTNGPCFNDLLKLVFILLSLFSFWGVSWVIKSANSAHTIEYQVRGNYLKDIHIWK